MQGGIGEDGVEFADERQIMGIQETRIDPQGKGSRNHVGAGVNTHHIAAQVAQPGGQNAIATADIENSLTRFRFKPAQNFAGEFGNESGVLIIGRGRPCLSTRLVIAAHLPGGRRELQEARRRARLGGRLRPGMAKQPGQHQIC